MQTPATVRALKILLGLLGLGALFGGAQFIIAPEGHLIGMNADLLQGSPFPNYLVPGIVLFVVHGICPFINVYALTRKPRLAALDWLGEPFGRHWSFTTSLLQGLALVIWIVVEMLILGVHWLMVTYLVWGVAIVLLTLARATRNTLALPRSRVVARAA